jgi:acetylornithine deacetylase/succinyl-diaminopimelate desuccinylase-like protein
LAPLSPTLSHPYHPAQELAAIDWAAQEQETALLLSRYLQFDTTNPPGQEAPAIEFLAEVLHERGFVPHIIEPAPGRANLIVRLSSQAGSAAPPCLLYAHADVVPADASRWSVPPFGGHMRDGFVWGRGALDDKSLGIIFLQVLTLLKTHLSPLQRDIILLIAADEEAHGRYGVGWLLDHHLDLIRAGYVWDEGGVGLRLRGEYLYNIAIAEKIPLTVKLVTYGTPGHAALPQTDNPQERLVRALSRLRQWERPARLVQPVIAMLQKLAHKQAFPKSFLFAWADRPWVWPLLRPLLETNTLFAPLIRNTMNLTMLRGGESSNVISAQAEARLDLRLLPGEDPLAVLADLRSLVADYKVSLEFEELPPHSELTPTDTEFYQALLETLGQLAPAGPVLPYLTPGATDSRYFRRAGMKAYGFMPMLLDSQELSRIHGVDERVSTANLRWGSQFVFETLRKLG